MSGPTVDDRLLRCYQAVALSGTRLASARGIDLIERGTSLAEADLWKCYSQTLKALGRHEDSLSAQIHAAGMRHPSPERDSRLRRLRWRLALLRASKGRRRDALATVMSPAQPPRRRSSPLEVAGRGMLGMVATAAAAIGAARWHPDRASRGIVRQEGSTGWGV